MADTYTIVNQAPITDLDGAGQVVPAMQVTFTTKPSGITSRVVIPVSHYGRDEVHDKVAAAARIIEDVQTL